MSTEITTHKNEAGEITALSFTLPNRDDNGKLIGQRLVSAPTGSTTFTLLAFLADKVDSYKSYKSDADVQSIRDTVEILSEATRRMRNTFDRNLKSVKQAGRCENVAPFIAEGRGRKSTAKNVVEVKSTTVL